GAVPRELEKITLPPYVIEAPDQLLVEVVQRVKVPKLDEKGVPEKDPTEKDGIKKVDATERLAVQPISGPFQVRLDGTVGLGFWGTVPVSGLTLDQAAEAIRQHLLQQVELSKLSVKPESIIVIVDVLAYNSKRYYIITDGGGFGEQVFPFPVTGSETVLDAIGNIYGLPDIASKRNIWVARRTPHPGQPWQILPVDWVGITQHGNTFTNYQVMPGDRIYVKAQRLVTIDRTLARIISPVERIFGITLLGTSTVNQISGRGNGFGGNNQ
ncbi:MAG: polysaccharide biosynthesis/export family protein, partial [Gemmataceae bacterium]|nr:polysaccharide biosynthesis/export family protein [Gemmataceae bacterium]